jgi:hypothetical protein
LQDFSVFPFLLRFFAEYRGWVDQNRKIPDVVPEGHSNPPGRRRPKWTSEPPEWVSHYLIGAACNAKRWVRRVAWEMKQAAAKTTGGIVGAVRPEGTAPATA